MRVAIANTTSAFVHIAALTGMAYWTLDSWQPRFQVAAGHAVTVQYALASASSDAEQTIQIELEPLPDTPLEIQEVKHEAQPVELQRKPPSAQAAETIPPQEIPELPSLDETLPITKVVADVQPENTSEASEEPSEEKPAAQPPQNQIAAVAVEFQSADIAGAVDQKPSPIVNPGPTYPLDALQAGVFERRAIVRARVAVNGTVVSAIVETSSGWPSMDEEALRTIRRWRFNPARRHGEAVEFDYRHLFEFGLRRS